jgi:hypothetical protein
MKKHYRLYRQEWVASPVMKAHYLWLLTTALLALASYLIVAFLPVVT